MADAFRDAFAFISPALDRSSAASSSQDRSQSDIPSDPTEGPRRKTIGEILECGYEQQEGPSATDRRTVLVKEALRHLQHLHDAQKAEDAATGRRDAYDGRLMATVYGLLDLICLQAILPSLSPGVEYPARPRSVLTPAAADAPGRDVQLLKEAIDILLGIIKVKGDGIEPIISQRGLPDIISGISELAFSPTVPEDVRVEFKPHFQQLFDSLPTSRILSIVTPYLRQQLPPWLRLELSSRHALLPLRPLGVRQVIEFVAASHRPPSDLPGGSGPQGGLPVTLDAVDQVTRLLSSVPSVTTAEHWFSGLAPQLLSLLDGEAGEELSQAASHIIGGGILGRRSTGGRGQIGWTLFAEPLLFNVNPSLNPLQDIEKRPPGTVIIPEKELSLALTRLFKLVVHHPNPGLTKRLMSPILTAVWGLLTYAQSTRKATRMWSDVPLDLLQRFLKFSADAAQIDVLAQNILFDGPPSWTFGPGSEGGIEIRSRGRIEDDASLDQLLQRMTSVNDRVALFEDLLAAGEVDDATIVKIFLNTTRRWLLPHNSEVGSRRLDILPQEPDPFHGLVNAKLAQEMAQKFRSQLESQQSHIIELVGQILEEFIEKDKVRQKRKASQKGKPTYSSLQGIVQQDSLSNNDDNNFSDTDAEDLVAMALSLLSALVTSESSTTPPKSKTPVDLSSLLPSLTYLSTTSDLPTALRGPATQLLSLLRPTGKSSTSSPGLSTTASSTASLIQPLMEDLRSPDPPTRVSALQALKRLLTTTKSDPSSELGTDIPTLTTLLLASLHESESYVHTAGVATLAALFPLAPRLVARLVADAFQDAEERTAGKGEEGVDFRLRVGEALCKALEPEVRLGSEERAAVSRIVGAALAVAGRRGERRATLAAKEERLKQAEREAERKREEARQAWGGEVPAEVEDVLERHRRELEQEDVTSERQRLDQETLQRIWEGWTETGVEEDVRVRASAVAVLAQGVETRLPAVEAATAAEAVRMVLAILALEREEHKTLLRRAAVLVLVGLVRGLEGLTGSSAASDKRVLEEIGKVIEWGEVSRVVEWVRDVEEDPIVKGHVGVFLEEWQMWRVGRVVGAVEQPKFGLEGNIRGLTVNVNADGGEKESRRLLIEEVE